MTSSAQLLTETVLSVFRANGLLLAWGDRFAAPLGLTSARWQMLGGIALAPDPMTAPRLAEAMGVSRQGAQKQLDLLVEDGLVAPEPNPAHQRSPFYVLTAEGRATYGKVNARWERQAQALATGITRADLEAARKVLAALIARLETDGA
jgi:DNA-binding MarR family transcriptional regulator